MIHSVIDPDFREEVLSSSMPVLVNFGAAWCGPCRTIEPILIQFQQQWQEQIKLVNINADDHLKLASRYKLRTLPTLIMFVNGHPIDRLEGFNGCARLRDNLDRLATIATISRRSDRQAAPMAGIDWRLVTID